jgi:hypothetical protein
MWRAFAAVGASLLVLAVPADIATSGSIPYAYYGGQGLTLVHFSVQLKRFLLDRGCV